MVVKPASTLAGGALRWRALPRDARDVLFLLAVIGWTVLPHLAHLPAWCGALTAAVLLWRAALALRGSALPGRWALAAVLALAIALTFWSYRTLLGKDAGVTLLVVLMVLKTLELRARRDALVVFFLGFFLVLTNFLYSQSLAVAAAMVASVWGLLTALVLAHMPVGQPALKDAGALAARAALFGAPVMVALFLLFPRMAPLWGLPQDAMGKTGLSGSLELGGMAEVALDDSIAFRVRFAGTAPQPESLYWRGPVLSRFDGREWRRLEPGFERRLRPQAELRTTGPGLPYEMTLEPSRLPLLPLLEATPDGPGSAPVIDGYRLRMSDELQWFADRPVIERLRFEARGWPRFEHGPREAVLGLQDYLQLPPAFNPRTLEWAAALRRDPRYAQAGAPELVQAVMAHIRAGFTYTLTPGTYGDERGRHAVDEFWMDRRQGFCEHFATAFVVVMRALDVPSRVVTGYQGADPVLQDGYLVVRNSHAHAWAEVWMRGRGWVRVDPTAAVAPERVVRSQALRPSPGLVGGAMQAMSPELAQQLRAAWELVNNRWNQWVLNYTRTQQFDLMRLLGVHSPSWEDLAYALIALLSGASIVGAAWAFWDRHRRDPWERLQSRLRARLARLGIEAHAHDGPRTLAQRVQARFGEPGAALAEALLALERERYGRQGRRRPARDWWQGFDRAASALQP